MRPVCLVTGASGKLGKALIERLSPGHDLICVHNRREPVGSSQVRRRLGHPPDARTPNRPDAYWIQADLRSDSDLRHVVDLALARFDIIDVVVNGAADTTFHGPLLDLAFSDKAVAQLELNCVQPLKLVSLVHHAVWKHDPDENRRRNRSVVNVSSISGLHAYASVGQAYYGASKAALNHLTRYLATELTPYSVRANALCPAKFPDTVPTSVVADSILQAIEGQATGEVRELSKTSLGASATARR